MKAKRKIRTERFIEDNPDAFEFTPPKKKKDCDCKDCPDCRKKNKKKH